MIATVVQALALLGAAFVLIAAIGMVRMPEFLWRLHAAAKAGTLGAGLLLAAVATAAPASIGSRAGAAALFLVLTAPVASHVLARRVGAAKNCTARDEPTPPSPVTREAA